MSAIPEQFFYRSLAYLEIAIISSKEIDNPLYNTGEYSNVTAYLLYHATELFLKFALFKATDTLVKGHDIFELHKQYQKQFVGERYAIVMPFGKPENIEYQGFTSEEIEELKKKYSMSFEQQLKYPIDTNSTVYNPVTSFTTDYLESYKKKFSHLYSVIA